MKHTLFVIMILCAVLTASARGITVDADNRAAEEVFREIMEQTGKNFVYQADAMCDVKVTVHARKRSLKRVLSDMFSGTDVRYKIRGNDIVLSRRRLRKSPLPAAVRYYMDAEGPRELEEVVVVASRLGASAVETAEIGAKRLSAVDVRRTPSLLGESDVIKTLQFEPGISGGTDGLAGMYVHGGNSDENLYMLDNVPLYQVNHFAGLFSAFNTEIIRNVDFFKSSVPAKYDGRLSSFMDVRTKNGSDTGHHGSGRLGLTSGAFNIGGPIGSRTTYAVALRRSWYDVLSVPMVALVNASNDEEKTRFHYYFMDLNAKVTHRFSRRTAGFVSAYFGDDMLRTGSKDLFVGYYDDDRYDMHWGNLVVQAGMNYILSPSVSAEFTAAYTRYFSKMKHEESIRELSSGNDEVDSSTSVDTRNNINDWIFRADFDWNPRGDMQVRFGAGYTRHSFLPSRTSRRYTFGKDERYSRDSTWAYGANEFNLYIEDDWTIGRHWRLNGGVHASLFNIDGRTHGGISPRLSASYRPSRRWAVKAAFCRTVQYVHQLSQSYLSLPTDQWVPVTGDFKPQTADKVSIGADWQSADDRFSASAEAFYKKMCNLVDYRDDYYLQPPTAMWNSRLTAGSGSARGMDFKFGKNTGKLTGHIAYSLLWADRTFAEKNGGKTFPARFDNRHTINVLLNWQVSDKVQLGAAWTGHSGNRFTLMTQVWDVPNTGMSSFDDYVPLRTNLNNYRLPFYHRLDLSCTMHNSRGYWTFGLYNAYCHINTVAIRLSYNDLGQPVFQKVKLLPVIPSISYTWIF